MPNNYILLETIALTQSAASVTFDNLPTSGYTDLKIVYSARTTAAARDDFFKVQLNGSSSNLSARVLYGSGSGVASFSDTSGYVGAIDAANATANTFNNGEFYLPNYRSTVAKSFSVDTVQEDNQTQAFITMTAGLWNPGTQAAITSIAFVPNSGSFVAGSTFSLYGIAAFGTTPVTAPKATGGNIVANDGTYWYHAFTSSGNFVPQVGLTADVLVVAGGGGGSGTVSAAGSAPGGGAGGLLLHSAQSLTTISYPVTVGSGGAGGANTAQGAKGNNSQFASLTLSEGGGRAGLSVSSGTATAGGNGGSGGGGGYSGNTPGAGGIATSGQGFNGGAGFTFAYSGGGGGAGELGNTDGNGFGGDGTSAYSAWGLATNTGQNVSGTVFYAGGGSGAGNVANSNGLGGGGLGGTQPNGPGQDGIANTGGGGGGAGDAFPNAANAAGGAGGSGIVIIRYPIA